MPTEIMLTTEQVTEYNRNGRLFCPNCGSFAVRTVTKPWNDGKLSRQVMHCWGSCNRYWLEEFKFADMLMESEGWPEDKHEYLYNQHRNFCPMCLGRSDIERFHIHRSQVSDRMRLRHQDDKCGAVWFDRMFFQGLRLVDGPELAALLATYGD